MRILAASVAVALLLLSGACAHPFTKIYPGMTEAQVNTLMEQAPSQTELFEEDYSAWYYGPDRCLLLHEGVVVAKQQTEETMSVATPVGTLREEVRAQCLPPGVYRPERRTRDIDIHLPDKPQGEKEEKKE